MQKEALKNQTMALTFGKTILSDSNSVASPRFAGAKKSSLKFFPLSMDKMFALTIF